MRDAVDVAVVAGARDGMPDTWERAHGLDPATDDSAGDRNRDGRTNVEAYLDWLTR